MSQRNDRKHPRLEIKAPARIKVSGNGPDGGPELTLMTRDLCAGGAFFHTDSPLPQGTKVLIDLVLSAEDIDKIESDQAFIKLDGHVHRTEDGGMAIVFAKEYDILSFKPS
ncbi:MAG: PilZ domain-containing protein [Thermodesulfobacteriota bacterium]